MTAVKTSDYVVACPAGACRESMSYPLGMLLSEPDAVRDGMAEWLLEHLAQSPSCVSFVTGHLPFAVVTYNPERRPATMVVGTVLDYFEP